MFNFKNPVNYLGWIALVILKGIEAVFPDYKVPVDDLILLLAGAGFHLNNGSGKATP